MLSFEQFTDFNGVFSRFLSKILFLCTRETSCKLNDMELTSMAEALPMLFKHLFDNNTYSWEK